MKFYDQNFVKLARRLREKGLTSVEIAKKLGINEGTILRWCYDISTNNPFHRHQQKIYKEYSGYGERVTKNFNLSSTSAKILCAILYLCEGARYPTANAISFTNSDVELIKLFIKLFRIGFKLDNKKFRVHLQLHTTHNIPIIFNFWSKILKIPKNQFYKPTITEPTKRMKRRNYQGTCSVRYHDFKIFHELMGIANGLMRNINGH
jgi:transcriptional regulator with XRE-family HTH domain